MVRLDLVKLGKVRFFNEINSYEKAIFMGELSIGRIVRGRIVRWANCPWANRPVTINTIFKKYVGDFCVMADS